MVVMANLGLSVYLLLYPDRSFEVFWINMKMEEMRRTFHSFGRVYRILVANRSIVRENPNSPHMK